MGGQERVCCPFCGVWGNVSVETLRPPNRWSQRSGAEMLRDQKTNTIEREKQDLSAPTIHLHETISPDGTSKIQVKEKPVVMPESELRQAAADELDARLNNRAVRNHGPRRPFRDCSPADLHAIVKTNSEDT